MPYVTFNVCLKTCCKFTDLRGFQRPEVAKIASNRQSKRTDSKYDYTLKVKSGIFQYYCFLKHAVNILMQNLIFST